MRLGDVYNQKRECHCPHLADIQRLLDIIAWSMPGIRQGSARTRLGPILYPRGPAACPRSGKPPAGSLGSG